MKMKGAQLPLQQLMQMTGYDLRRVTMPTVVSIESIIGLHR